MHPPLTVVTSLCDTPQLRVLRGDNEYAYAPAPAISSTDQASAAFYNYHVQCDNDFIKLAVIPEGACTATRVTEELSSMWGKDFAPIRTCVDVSRVCAVLVYHHRLSLSLRCSLWLCCHLHDWNLRVQVQGHAGARATGLRGG